MSNVTPGGTYRWTANTEILGVPGTPTVLTLTVADPSSNTVAGFPIALGGLGNSGTGQYYCDWVTLTSAAGVYVATWAGTLNGLPILATDTVDVGQGGSPTAGGQYATVAGMAARLGSNDTIDYALWQSMCDQANMWIETKTGRILAPFVVTST